jgi:sulfofructose kinase
MSFRSSRSARDRARTSYLSMTSIRDVEVIGLGQACVDYVGRVPVFPQEDGKVELLDLHSQCGGPASTALVTLSRLGITCSFLGSVSDDPFGADVLQGLRDDGVDFSFLKIRPGYTSQFAFIAVSGDHANRTVFWHRGTVPQLEKHEVDLSPFSGAKVLHLDGLMIEASLEAARQAKDAGLAVVLDAGTLREGSLQIVALVDVLIASAKFAESLVGTGVNPEKALDALASLGPKTVVITFGRKGSVGSDGKSKTFQEAFPVKSLDTTGAGDVYHGGYIYGFLQGWPMSECMRFASAVAAMKCRDMGARKGIPRLEEVRAFMKSFS